MTPFDQSLAQPHHDALPAAVLENRQSHVVELDDVHHVGRVDGSGPASRTRRYTRT